MLEAEFGIDPGDIELDMDDPYGTAERLGSILEEQQRKTDLTQQVTVAYKNRDLLQLLELQLTVEQIDQDAIDSINEDRLKHFNKILQRQSQELKQEIEEVELHMRAAGGLDPFESLTPNPT
jgi:hypothetical protein